MKNNTIMWLVVGGIALYALYQMQQNQQAANTTAQINAGSTALGLLGSDLANLGDI